MGKPQNFSQKIGLTRGKAILVGGLAVALVAVIYRQYGQSDEGEAIAMVSGTPELQLPAASLNLPPPVQQAAAEVPAATTRLAMTAAFDQSKWTPPELATVVAYDPFALPAAFPQPPMITGDSQLAAEGDGGSADASADAATRLADALAALQMELAALQERGVNVIVRGRNEYVAMIGDRTVHVGDEINGFTITAIEPDGVRVERKIQE